MTDAAVPGSMPIFAYGSNMCWQRVRDRVPSVVICGKGHVTHRRLFFHKLGADGSGKANTVFTGRARDLVWGALHRMSGEDRLVLDACEGGYGLEKVNVVQDDGTTMAALTYVALEGCVREGLEPLPWYRDTVVRGARELELPGDYVAFLEGGAPAGA